MLRRRANAEDSVTSEEELERYAHLKTCGQAQKQSLNYELNFLNLLKWTLKIQCTGQLVQLLFAAISLFFLPFCQNEGFWIKRCPQYCYTHRGRVTEA